MNLCRSLRARFGRLFDVVAVLAVVLILVLLFTSRQAVSNPNTPEFSPTREVQLGFIAELPGVDKQPVAAKSHPAEPHDHQQVARLNILNKLYQIPHVDDSVYGLRESASRHIDLDRPPPNLRPYSCQKHIDLAGMPTISIIIPIYNNALSMVLRVLHSAISTTPPQLLKDVILVDDNSEYRNLKTPLLESYLSMVSNKIKVVKNLRQEGLVRARMRGIEVAQGDILVFQDADSEFGSEWAEPAIDYIVKHPQSIVQPRVHDLNAEDISWPKRAKLRFEERKRGVFTWDLNDDIHWNIVQEKLPSDKHLPVTKPFPNPVLIGSSIIVSREYFLRIGGFDTGLDTWGEENVELSFRTWLCGGEIVVHPCSQVAHVFKTAHLVSGKEEKTVIMDKIRIAEMWMGDHKDYFYASNPIFGSKSNQLTPEKSTSLEKYRQQIREKLSCKSFEWYLDNVLPEMVIPDKSAVEMFGEIHSPGATSCWKVHEDNFVVIAPRCMTPSKIIYEAQFYITKEGRLMYRENCVSVEYTHLLKVVDCDEEGHWTTGWSFDVSAKDDITTGYIKFVHPNSGRMYCVTQITNVNDEHHQEQMPQIGECHDNLSDSRRWQIWSFTYHFNFTTVVHGSDSR